MSKPRRDMDHRLLRIVGERLRDAIKAARYTQEKVTAELGFSSRENLAHCLAGNRAMALDQFINLCMLVDRDPAEILRLDRESAAELEQEKHALEQEIVDILTRMRSTVGSEEYERLKTELDRKERERVSLERRLKYLSKDKNSDRHEE